MDLDLVLRLAAASNQLAVVATSRANGSVHASLVSAGVIDDPITGAASIGMVIRGDARKLVYLRRGLQATTVFHSGPQWVAVEGPVRLAGPDDESSGISPVDVPPLLRAIFVAAGGTHGDWAEYDRVMATERAPPCWSRWLGSRPTVDRRTGRADRGFSGRWRPRPVLGPQVSLEGHDLRSHGG